MRFDKALRSKERIVLVFFFGKKVVIDFIGGKYLNVQTPQILYKYYIITTFLRTQFCRIVFVGVVVGSRGGSTNFSWEDSFWNAHDIDWADFQEKFIDWYVFHWDLRSSQTFNCKVTSPKEYPWFYLKIFSVNVINILKWPLY